MAERRPITLQARDGAVLRGFLTLPPGREPKHLPLVVMPQGGPFGSQDTWDWDADAQMLASRGYAVLQVNFRGSGGFGKAFQEQGRNAWHNIGRAHVSPPVTTQHLGCLLPLETKKK